MGLWMICWGRGRWGRCRWGIGCVWVCCDLTLVRVYSDGLLLVGTGGLTLSAGGGVFWRNYLLVGIWFTMCLGGLQLW